MILNIVPPRNPSVATTAGTATLRKRHNSTEPEGFGYHAEENGSDNRLRVYFRFDRSLLGKLCRAAYETLREVVALELRDDDAVPAMIATPQSFGDLIEPS